MLLEPDDAPLLSWEYLEGLERTGCVGPSTSWQPMHILLRRVEHPSEQSPGRLLAAAPVYVKYDSDGEWVLDVDWATYAASVGIEYYPKLISAVPFNPVSGSRLLTAPHLPPDERAEHRRLLLGVLSQLTKSAGLSSAHVLFHRLDSKLGAQLEQAGYLQRRQEQYHFHNAGYGSFEDYLRALNSHRRTAIRRERRSLREAGITVRTYRGLDCEGGFNKAQLDAMFDMYCGTSVRYTGGAPYLNRTFFHLCAARLKDRLELVLAYRGSDDLVGGAWNLRGDNRLFGRYWGEARSIPYLHFEVCYYHSIERCITERLQAFEPGHGGEHKLLRGFSPVYTHSAHYLRSTSLRQPIATYLHYEASYIEQEVQAAMLRCPLRSVRLSAALAASPPLPQGHDDSSGQQLERQAAPGAKPRDPFKEDPSPGASLGRGKTNGLTR